MTTALLHPHTNSSSRDESRTLRRASSSIHGIAFWLAATAFLVNMGMSAVPTPLYPLYQQRDGFSNLMITIIYGVYAIGVVASLFIAGHLSDAHGRRRVFIPALLINAVSGVVFIL